MAQYRFRILWLICTILLKDLFYEIGHLHFVKVLVLVYFCEVYNKGGCKVLISYASREHYNKLQRLLFIKVFSAFPVSWNPWPYHIEVLFEFPPIIGQVFLQLLIVFNLLLWIRSDTWLKFWLSTVRWLPAELWSNQVCSCSNLLLLLKLLLNS